MVDSVGEPNEGASGRRYVALIGDIVGSREADDRAELQERFRGAVERANAEVTEFWGSPASPATITTGDEFQALFETVEPAVGTVRTVSDEMAPSMLRFGLGYGPLETEVNPDQAIGMDGPCLQRARQALERAEQEGGWVRLAGFAPSPELDSAVAALMDLVGGLKGSWTDRQAELVRTLRRLGGTQKEVAEELGLAPSTVSEGLKAAEAGRIRDAENGAARLIGHFLDRGEGP